jgi:hypothetical protein
LLRQYACYANAGITIAGYTSVFDPIENRMGIYNERPNARSEFRSSTTQQVIVLKPIGSVHNLSTQVIR